MELEIKDIEKILQQFQDSNICEIKLEAGDVKLTARKKEVFSGNEAEARGVAAPVPMMVPPVNMETAGTVIQASESSDAATADNKTETAQTSGTNDQSGTVLTTPLAGVFYRSPKPGEPPYVEVGSHVKKGDTVGLIEAMKIINEIPAPCDGTVLEIFAENEEFVQLGGALMRIGGD